MPRVSFFSNLGESKYFFVENPKLKMYLGPTLQTDDGWEPFVLPPLYSSTYKHSPLVVIDRSPGNFLRGFFL